MKKYNLLLLSALIFFTMNAVGRADTVSLTMDSSQSEVDMSVNNSMFENSAIAGTGTLDATSCDAPFGVAQITDMDLVLVDGLSFNLLGPAVTATTQAGDVTISMVTPGAGGTVSGGTFDQLGNLMAFGGTIQLNDPANLLGGNQTIDLSTLAPSSVDLLGTQISRVGNTKIISGAFSLTDQLDAGNGILIPIVANGTFFASGEVSAVPEPGAMIWLVAFFSLVAVQRQRV